MGWKGRISALVVLAAVLSAFVVQDPLFFAKFGVLLPSGNAHLAATPYLFASPPSPWPASGFAYACGTAGPGVLMVTNSGQSTENLTAVSITYSGTTFTATGPGCALAPGSTGVSITALSTFAPPKGTSFQGYLTTSGGGRVPFSGTWA